MAVAPHSSTLAWKIPWMEEPGRLQSMWSLRVRHTEQLHFHFHGTACEILAPQPGIQAGPPALETRSLNPWTTREVLDLLF